MFAIWGKTIYYLVYCYFGRIAAWMFFCFQQSFILKGYVTIFYSLSNSFLAMLCPSAMHLARTSSFIDCFISTGSPTGSK